MMIDSLVPNITTFVKLGIKIYQNKTTIPQALA